MKEDTILKQQIVESEIELNSLKVALEEEKKARERYATRYPKPRLTLCFS